MVGIIEFGTDGIRGVAGQYPLDPATVLRIGRATGKWLQSQSDGEVPYVLIGHDTRISGHMLAHALIAGLLSEGVYVSNVGVITTPGIAFLTRQGIYSLGIMVSASHNPFEQNGIKVFGPDGFKLPDEAEVALETHIAQADAGASAAKLGQFEAYDASELYVSHLTNFGTAQTLKGLRVVLDCANGAAYEIAPDAFQRDGADVVALHAEPDGYNINVNAGSEHVRRNRIALLEAVRAHGADLGLAFDGDADRVVCVTPEGAMIDGDHLLGILAPELKQQGKLNGNTVVATEMSNSGLEHYLNAHGIALIRTKVGDRFVMEKMRAGGYILGGEQAGHVILLDGERTVGDGIWVGLKLAALVATSKREGGPTLHEMAARIPRYPQVIASAHLAGRVELAEVRGLEAQKQATLGVFGGKGRINMRFSGTEPNLLRVMVEGGPETNLNAVIERALALCRLVAESTKTTNPVIDVVDCVTGAPVSV